jgi:DNA-binding beta-propeller fold protein YncE
VRPFLSSCVFVAALCLCRTGSSGEKPALQLKQTIRLPGVEGRIDHMDFDAASQRLFVCALGNNTLEVIDTLKGERLHSITGLGSPQGVAYIPDSNRIFVTNDKGGVCKFYDGKTYQSIGELSLRDDADNVRYDAATHQIYAGFGTGGIEIISAAEAKSVGSIKLGAHPEAFALAKQQPRIFVNVPDAKQVAVIDRAKAAVIATWKTDGASGNFPIALDEANRRLFVGCRLPSKLIVLNTESGEVVANIGIAADPDDLFYDAKRHRIYAICGAGQIDVIEQGDANTYKSYTTIETSSGARTGFFAPEQDALFVAVPQRDPQSAEIRRYQAE